MRNREVRQHPKFSSELRIVPAEPVWYLSDSSPKTRAYATYYADNATRKLTIFSRFPLFYRCFPD